MRDAEQLPGQLEFAVAQESPLHFVQGRLWAKRRVSSAPHCNWIIPLFFDSPWASSLEQQTGGPWLDERQGDSSQGLIYQMPACPLGQERGTGL